MKSLVHTEELCSRSVPLEHAPGAKSLVCIGLNETEATYPGARKYISVVSYIACQQDNSLPIEEKTCTYKITFFTRRYHPALSSLKKLIMAKWHLMQN